MEQQLDLFGKNINYNIPKNKKKCITFALFKRHK